VGPDPVTWELRGCKAYQTPYCVAAFWSSDICENAAPRVFTMSSRRTPGSMLSFRVPPMRQIGALEPSPPPHLSRTGAYTCNFCYDSIVFPKATGIVPGRFLHRMATDKELNDFLANVERRAFKQAVYAVRKDESALDIVQDAMIKLAEKYGDKPAAELPMLFQRILQTTILDYFRREKVRNTWVSLFSGLGRREEEDEDFDILASYEAEEGTAAAESSADQVERAQTLSLIENEIQKLPTRQREAFLMRYWQDMDVAETAEAMGVSEGSVKTHCSRATHTLAEALKAKGIKL
jgi:RNA polymerase sigma factor (sigma-70 family)